MAGQLVGYARVSSRDQDLEVQIKQLQDAGCTKIFYEKASAANGKVNRPQFDACMNYVRDGDILVVTRLDRFSRSTLDFHRSMAMLTEKNVQFRCLLQPIDTTSPTGRLMRDILAAFAEFETSIRKERQMEGIAAAKERGVYKAKKGEVPRGKMAWASRLLGEGCTFAQVHEKTGIPLPTLYRRFPDYVRKAKAKKMAEVASTLPSAPAIPSPAEAVGTQGIIETPPRQRGILGKIFGTSPKEDARA